MIESREEAAQKLAILQSQARMARIKAMAQGKAAA
jgi:hypothetical protein